MFKMMLIPAVGLALFVLLPATTKASLADLIQAGYTPIILNRVSSSSQRSGLPAQAEENKRTIKAIGFTKTPEEITIAQSGKAADLKTIKKLKAILKNNPDKSYVVFVRDIARFGRSALNNLDVVTHTLEPARVPLVPLDMMQTVGANGTPESWMIFGILSAIAESAKAGEERARDVGQKQAAEKGLFEGVPQNLYPKLYKKGKSLQRRIWEAYPAMKNKTMTASHLWKKEGIYPQNGRTILNRLIHADSHGKVEELLSVQDAIIVAEKSRNVGARNRKPYEKTRRAKALHRVTVAYLREPEKWPNPLTVGNPQTATEEHDLATGTIADALENPSRYQPPKP
jgi:DNA invertase Pin-like site-specific DNA recombinase